MNDTFLKIESISLAVFAIGSLLFIIVIVVSSAISAKRAEKKFQNPPEVFWEARLNSKIWLKALERYSPHILHQWDVILRLSS